MGSRVKSDETATTSPMKLAQADGCTRVGIHPMAFLGRTRRLQSFKFQDNLRVGEHEQ